MSKQQSCICGLVLRGAIVVLLSSGLENQLPSLSFELSPPPPIPVPSFSFELSPPSIPVEKRDRSQLLNDLSSPDPDLRASAAVALGQLGDKSVIPKLLPLLKDSSSWVRFLTASGLGQLGDKSVVPNLLALLTSPKPLDRLGAVIALGKLGDKSIVPHLLPILQDRNEEALTRRTAAIALGRLGDKSTVPFLLPFLKDANPDVRSEVARVLQQLSYTKP